MIQSSKNCSVALLKNDKVFIKNDIAPKMHANLILVFIEDVLLKANLSLKDINALAFGVGPGAFTGLRIAVSVAHALHSALNIPMIKISTLKTLSFKALSKGYLNIVSLIDARQNEVYFCKYQFDSNHNIIYTSDELLLSPNSALDFIQNQDVLIGDDFLNYLEFNNLANKKILLTVTAEDMLLIAKEKFMNRDFVDILDAQPNYIRNKIVN